jgi:hypothetical protein
MRVRSRLALLACLGFTAAPANATVLTTESFSLPIGPGNSLAAPYMDEVVNTSPTLSTWGEKGAIGLQGDQSIFYNGSAYVDEPASVVAFKFNIGSTIDALNTTYGAGNWTISNPAITMQYTYYANNSVFGGGAGTFETYVVQNNSWFFSNSGSGSAGVFNGYVAGEDPAYATTPSTLLTWSGGQADLGSTTYNWLSPTDNPNYPGWVTEKSGPNQGMLTDTLSLDPLLVSDVTSASAASNPNVSFYMIPNDDTLGLTIFTGGGNVTPAFTFDVVAVPEPASIAILAAVGIPLLRRRRGHE